MVRSVLKVLSGWALTALFMTVFLGATAVAYLLCRPDEGEYR